jgi:hypothetical protein
LTMERGGVRYEIYMLNARLITYGKLVFSSIIDKSLQHAADSDLNHVLVLFRVLRMHVKT